jgi:cellulose synthase/poly-beta-1,6-N-acetylglucosamine synthase-like glycosyltransferase
LSLFAQLIASSFFGLIFGVLLLCALLEATELFELQRGGIASCNFISAPSSGEPFVSIHVPICSEPPEVVARTLCALSKLKYDAFEILVIDNNTADEKLWRPIEALCLQLGARFRFYHLDKWPGFKAGALNFAMLQTSPAAQIVGVVDADYEIVPEYLAELVGFFDDAQVAFLQTPQDYRDWSDKRFTRWCYWEYWQVFAVSMFVRSRANAILMHGTMSLVRKDAIARVGGWAEWCLTEDSELGLRLLANSSRGIYVTKTYGRGLVPFSFGDYKRQRRRWVIGGAQQLRRHKALFFAGSAASNRITTMQKMLFLRGWLLWFRDAVIVLTGPILIFAAAAVVGGVLQPVVVLPLAIGLASIVLQLLVRHIVVYRIYLHTNWRDTFGATLANMSLTWTVGCAFLAGSTFADHIFQRTPKRSHAEPRWIEIARGETMMGATMLCLAVTVYAVLGGSGWAAIAATSCYALLMLPAPLMAWRSARDASSSAPSGGREKVAGELQAP